MVAPDIVRTCEKKREKSTLYDFFFRFFVHIFVSLLKASPMAFFNQLA